MTTTPVPRWGAVTVDCFDLDTLANFWGALLGTSVRGRWEQYVHLHPVLGGLPPAFQRVESKAEGKNALHLDLHVADEHEVQQVTARAVELGAHVLERVRQGDTRWVVLEDPEGNRFCVVAVPTN
jgi:predicted enzyme related to lactoylglutathione lyase